MNTHIEKKDFLGLAISLALSVLYCGAFWRQTSFTSMILCCLILLFGFFTLKKEPKNILQRDEKLFALSLLLFFVSALLSFLVGHGYELKSIRNPSMPSLLDIDLPSKYLLGALIFVLFLKLKFVLQKRIDVSNYFNCFTSFIISDCWHIESSFCAKRPQSLIATRVSLVVLCHADKIRSLHTAM